MKSKLYSILKESSQPLSAADMWENAEVRLCVVSLTWVANWWLKQPHTAASCCHQA